jgi:6-phosphofructokinase 2
MAGIATLTFNPALDLSVTTDRVVPTSKLRCRAPRYDPGGGGINVARVVKNLGGDATAIYAAGGLIGDILRSCLDEIGLSQVVVPVAGMTRENMTVDEASTGEQYRFVMPGPALSQAEIRSCLDAVEALDPSPAYLVVSGGYPPGAAEDRISDDVAALANRLGARLVLDTSQAMLHSPEHGVFLMKPNLGELSRMLGRPLIDRAEQIAGARSVVREGRAEVLVVSLGHEGALLVTDTLAEYYPTPDVPIRSAVGAGDSMVGAIVFAIERGWSLIEAVRYGVAAGAATLMTPGTELCRREDAQRLHQELSGSSARSTG